MKLQPVAVRCYYLPNAADEVTVRRERSSGEELLKLGDELVELADKLRNLLDGLPCWVHGDG